MRPQGEGGGGCGGGDVMSKRVQKVIFWANVMLKNAFWEQNTCLKSRKVHNYIENVFFFHATHTEEFMRARGGAVSAVCIPQKCISDHFGAFFVLFCVFSCVLVQSRGIGQTPPPGTFGASPGSGGLVTLLWPAWHIGGLLWAWLGHFPSGVSGRGICSRSE